MLFFQITIYEVLTIPVLPRLKVSIIISGGTYSLRVRLIFMNLIGFDVSCENPDLIGLGQQNGPMQARVGSGLYT